MEGIANEENMVYYACYTYNGCCFRCFCIRRQQITKDQATPSVEVLPVGTGSNEKAADKIGIVDNMNKPVIETTSDAKVEILDPATDQTSALDPKKISTSSSLGLFSITYPTSFWNINSLGTYIAEFSGVRDTIYTHYYFPTNSSGEMKIRGAVNEDYPHSMLYHYCI